MALSSIVFINMGGNRERDIPLCEVKFKSRDLTIIIRKEFGKKKKGGADLGRLGIFNSVTLATRVRIKIMWAVAKKPGNDNEIRTVLSYCSWPILQIKDKEGSKRRMSLGFADNISRFGKGLREEDLAPTEKQEQPLGDRCSKLSWSCMRKMQEGLDPMGERGQEETPGP